MSLKENSNYGLRVKPETEQSKEPEKEPEKKSKKGFKIINKHHKAIRIDFDEDNQSCLIQPDGFTYIEHDFDKIIIQDANYSKFMADANFKNEK